MDGGAWWATVHGSQRVGHDWATSLSLQNKLIFFLKWVDLKGNIYSVTILVVYTFWKKKSQRACLNIWGVKDTVLVQIPHFPVVEENEAQQGNWSQTMEPVGYKSILERTLVVSWGLEAWLEFGWLKNTGWAGRRGQSANSERMEWEGWLGWSRRL